MQPKKSSIPIIGCVAVLPVSNTKPLPFVTLRTPPVPPEEFISTLPTLVPFVSVILLPATILVTPVFVISTSPVF